MSEPTQKQKDDLARTINQVDMVTEMLRQIKASMSQRPTSTTELSHYEEIILDTHRTINNAIDEIAGIGNLARREGWVPEKGKW